MVMSQPSPVNGRKRKSVEICETWRRLKKIFKEGAKEKKCKDIWVKENAK